VRLSTGHLLDLDVALGDILDPYRALNTGLLKLGLLMTQLAAL